MSDVIITILIIIVLACLVRHFEIKMRNHEKTIFETVGEKIKGAKRWLVVDDDELQQELIRHNMIPKDCKIHVATSREEALNLIHTNEYDLILLDIKLIGENGGSVLKTMRAEGNNTSVVIITGYADSEIYDMSIKLDAPVIEKQHLSTHFKTWSKAFKQA